MHTLVIAIVSAAAAATATHFYKTIKADTAETIARDYAAARARVTATVAGAKALVEKLEATL